MNPEHLEFLHGVEHPAQGPVGANPLHWGQYVLGPDFANPDLDRTFDRNGLLAYCRNRATTDLNAVVAILAWGGMRRNHAQSLFARRDTWLPVIGRLRRGEFPSRAEAYEAFRELRAADALPGMRPAYFTKLICFLAPRLNGYIMDQWTSRSALLLTDFALNLILNADGTVSDANLPEQYEAFCLFLEELAVQLACPPLEAEERIFSEGRGRGAWRNYVLANWPA